MEFLFGLQIPYGIMVGWEMFLEKEEMGYKSFSLYLFFVFIEVRWSIDE